MVSVRVLLAGTLALAACRGPQPRAERWFAERGQRATSWHACVRLGAGLRAGCDGDRTCEARVTTEVTRPCYAARYRAATENARPEVEIPPSALSPCFWNRGPRPTSSPVHYAQAECDGLAIAAALRSHCAAELRAVIEGLCIEGSTDLTGSGP